MTRSPSCEQSKAEEQCFQRVDFLTEELEERLRTHWPRKGRAEVSTPLYPSILPHMQAPTRQHVYVQASYSMIL
jgi:hypothetical protein